MTTRYTGPTRTDRDAIYIAGSWVPSAGRGTIAVVDPTTAEPIGSIPDGTAADVLAAVAAARSAFETWASTAPPERGRYLDLIADGLEDRSEELAELIAHEVGMPKAQCREWQVPIEDFRVAAELARTYPFDEKVGASLVLHEPVGVVAAITPWNYPLSQIAAKVAPALAAGCTVVLKPSEVAPLNAFVLAEVVDAVGLPAGVFNLVSGTGDGVGEPLAAHPDVDMVSFTGSTRAGKRVGELAMRRVARVTLELGGKSPLVILDDADLEAAVGYGVHDCYGNSGQTCNALTRMLVPRDRLAEAESIAAAVADALVVGDPLDERTDLGPLVSAVQQERVRSYIKRGVDEGAALVTGGDEPPAGLAEGYFVRPTVFSGVTNDMTIAREEIFGPVLVLIPHDGEDDAVRIANDTDYGLWAGVWSGDGERAARVARRLRAGGVAINGATADEPMPFGGYKQSGIGRELGRFGLQEYLEVKSLVL
jgi:aldehyde dehydrogenase (NAD+)